MDHKSIIKEMVRECFFCAKESDDVEDKLCELGIIIDSGVQDVFYHWERVMESFIPEEEFADECRDDFMCFSDFEAFWNKHCEWRI